MVALANEGFGVFPFEPPRSFSLLDALVSLKPMSAIVPARSVTTSTTPTSTKFSRRPHAFR